MNIPFTRPYFDEEEEKAVIEVLRSGWVTQGPKIPAFESAVAGYLNVPHAVALNSCASALHLAMIAEGIGRGDEVICPSYTFIATPNCIEYVNARPIFADVDFLTSNIDPHSVEEKITRRTKAILVVHQNGMACDLDSIRCIADSRGIVVVEDAAYGMGVQYKGQKIGGFSPITCFSFHPRKTISTGEGGIFATLNKNYDELARSLRAHGASISVEAREQAKGTLYEQYTRVGYNYKMTDLQAALGIAQLKKLEWAIARRQELAQRYCDELRICDRLLMPVVPEGYNHTFGTFQAILLDAVQEERDKLIRLLAAEGVPTRRGIPSCHLEPLYLEKYGCCSLPVTERLSQSAIFLPMYPQMTSAEQDFIISAIQNQIKKI